jgi:hypothetical protein
MKRTINLNDFKDAFRESNWEHGFSYEGLEALYNGLIAFEEDCDTEIELCVISLCQDFTEYDSLKEFQEHYGDKYKSIEDIDNNTCVYEIPETTRFIVRIF